MANTKKYVSLDKLGLYDEKIKQLINNADATSLQSAKDYADSLATNYEAAGSVNAAKTELQGKIDAVDAKAIQAQNEVDALEGVVAGMYTNEQIDKAISDAQTAATYDDTKVKEDIQKNANAIAKEVTDRETAVAGVQSAVDTLAGTHAADKTELEGKITAAQNAANKAQEEVDALEQTHATDKAALEAAIALKADQTALDEVAGVANAAATKAEFDEAVEALEAEDARIVGLVEAEAAKAREEEGKLDARLVKVETFFETAEDETINEAMDTLVEIQKYITEDGAAADQMVKDIAANAKAIEDMDAAYKAADTTLQGNIDTLAGTVATKADASVVEGIDGRLTTAEGKVTTLEGKVSTLEGEMDAVEAAVATKVETEAYNAKVKELEDADAEIEGRLDDIEAVLGTGEGSVADQIATAKQEAIDAAAAAADTKDEAILAAAKKYADDEDAKIESTVSDLTAVVDTKAAQADLEALAGRVTTAEGKITTLEGKMTTVEGKVAANETEIAKKADKATTLEGYGIADAYTKTEVDNKITAVMDSIVEVSAEEINNLFA